MSTADIARRAAEFAAKPPADPVAAVLKERQRHYAAMVSADRAMRAEAHKQASAAARKDPSDPFTYSRIFSHVMNGISEEFG